MKNFSFGIIFTIILFICDKNSFCRSRSLSSSCGEVKQCFIDKSGNDPSNYLSTCIEKCKDCDETCFTDYINFASCIQKCFICENLDQIFPWNCIDNCKDGLSPLVGKIINCVFDPCKSNYNGFIIALYIGFFIFISILIMKAFYYCKLRKSGDEANMIPIQEISTYRLKN